MRALIILRHRFRQPGVAVKQTVGVDLFRRQSLSARRILACRNCGAPGVYKSVHDIQMRWPGCFVLPTDARVDRPVGDDCPNCDAPRIATEADLGEIWSKEWRAASPNLLRRCIDFFRKRPNR